MDQKKWTKNACISLHLFVHEAVPGVYVEDEVTSLAEIMTRFDGLPRSTDNSFDLAQEKAVKIQNLN